jgi:hypothetical protein
MKIKFGAAIVDGRGKIGGHVASANRGGAYLKTKKTPVNRKTNLQTTVRSRISQLSKAWVGLTAAQRAAWNAAVGSWQRTNIFGDLRKPSGLNLYVRLNANILMAGGSTITTPPVPVAVNAITSASASVQDSNGAVALTFAPTVPTGVAMVVRATSPQSAGKSYVKNQFRNIKSVAAAQTSPQALGSDYAAVFGAPKGVGLVVWFELFYVNTTTGQTGPHLVFSQAIS